MQGVCTRVHSQEMAARASKNTLRIFICDPDEITSFVLIAADGAFGSIGQRPA